MKDSIRRRGENISSFEVERVIMSHPAVEIAAVFPVPSDLAEDEVMTTVVVKEGAALNGEELVRILSRAGYRISRSRASWILYRLAAHRKRQGAEIQAARAAADRPDTWDREAAGIKLKR